MFAGVSPLVRLFSLHRGEGDAPDFSPLRAVIDAAERNLEVLRFAADDAVDAEPMMPPSRGGGAERGLAQVAPPAAPA
jgi:hypothetical protein